MVSLAEMHVAFWCVLRTSCASSHSPLFSTALLLRVTSFSAVVCAAAVLRWGYMVLATPAALPFGLVVDASQLYLTGPGPLNASSVRLIAPASLGTYRQFCRLNAHSVTAELTGLGENTVSLPGCVLTSSLFVVRVANPYFRAPALCFAVRAASI
jgi:hypothetical protein